ncbi:hypothetical protein QTH97_24215 [Variovorax sp. J22R24]|uniref:hypothetical protein n=1 Tax=Variovorax gracilis TaxID=3053502 RepID=UPI0025775B57|nr:hypothetical protein [Variovorax sp. J22R24]MDM0108075.1 hypothetical protein [Variovorax sp. J22R24]
MADSSESLESPDSPDSHAGTYLPIARMTVIVSGPVETHGPQLDKALVDAADAAMDEMLLDLNLDVPVRGRLVILESRPGSWEIEAVVNFWTGAVFAYGALDAIAKAPKIVEGISTIKKSIKAEFAKRVRKVAPEATGVKVTMEAVPVATGFAAVLADAQAQGRMVQVTVRGSTGPSSKGSVVRLEGELAYLVLAEGGELTVCLADISAVVMDRPFAPNAASAAPAARASSRPR